MNNYIDAKTRVMLTSIKPFSRKKKKPIWVKSKLYTETFVNDISTSRTTIKFANDYIEVKFIECNKYIRIDSTPENVKLLVKAISKCEKN